MPTFKISDNTHQEFNKFKEYMRSQEYANSPIIGYCTCLSRFLWQTDSLLISALKESIGTVLETKMVVHPQTFKECHAALRLCFRVVTGGRLKDNPKENSIPEITEQLQRFREYSLVIKHIKESTIISEISHVRKFLEYTFAHN